MHRGSSSFVVCLARARPPTPSKLSGTCLIEKLQWKLAQDLLTLGHNVIIEWGTWTRSERDALRAGARALGAAVELHFLDAPVEVLFERIRHRNTESPPVTLDDMVKWAEIFERPSAEEMALFDPRL